MRLHDVGGRRWTARACALAGVLVACAVPARAATPTATADVVPGTLSVATSASPSISAALNGLDQEIDYTIPLDVVDARGSGAGWNLTITSTTFSTGGATPRTFPTDASTVFSVAAACSLGTCTPPSFTLGFYPPRRQLPAGSTSPTPLEFYNSNTDTGMGGITVTPTVRVNVPANAYVGVYTSTVTVAVVSGP